MSFQGTTEGLAEVVDRSSASLASFLQRVPFPAHWEGPNVLHVTLGPEHKGQCPLDLTEFYQFTFLCHLSTPTDSLLDLHVFSVQICQKSTLLLLFQLPPSNQNTIPARNLVHQHFVRIPEGHTHSWVLCSVPSRH